MKDEEDISESEVAFIWLVFSSGVKLPLLIAISAVLITQRKLATLLGVSQATISLALRGDETIPPATRARVLAAAQAHGYFPNPQVSSLMRQIRAGESTGDHGCLALIIDAADEAGWLTHPGYRQQLEGFNARATLRGYRTERFYLAAPGMTSRRLDQILTARGINGLALMAPRRRASLVLDFQWERYAVVAGGYTWTEPAVDRVFPHYRQQMELALAHLEARSCRRIGFLLPDAVRYRVDKNWLLGWFLYQEQLPPERQIPRFALELGTPGADDAFRHWLRQWRVDGVLLQSNRYIEGVAGHFVELGAALPLVCLFHDAEGSPGIDAVDERNDVIGTMLCDHLIAKLNQGELGLAAHPKQILVAGELRLNAKAD